MRIILICRGHSRREYQHKISTQGEREMEFAAKKCERFGFTNENTTVFTSPTEEERISAAIVTRHLDLALATVLEWLNDTSVEFQILTAGLFYGRSLPENAIIVLEKPVLEKILLFLSTPNHSVKSGDAFLINYQHNSRFVEKLT